MLEYCAHQTLKRIEILLKSAFIVLGRIMVWMLLVFDVEGLDMRSTFCDPYFLEKNTEKVYPYD